MSHPLLAALDNPDLVGSSEYRAIYDCLDDALANDDGMEFIEQPRDLVLAMVEEFEAYCADIRRRLATW